MSYVSILFCLCVSFFMIVPVNAAPTADDLNTDLCILLYIGAVSPNQTYKQSEICTYLWENKPMVTTIKNNPPMLQQIYNDFIDEAQSITVTNKQEQCIEDDDEK